MVARNHHQSSTSSSTDDNQSPNDALTMAATAGLMSERQYRTGVSASLFELAHTAKGRSTG